MAYQIAEVYAWRGEKDKTFEWLQVSLDNHDTGLLSLMIDPLVQGLRHDARYNDVLTKIGFCRRRRDFDSGCSAKPFVISGAAHLWVSCISPKRDPRASLA
jgi:hypothetical protein